MVGSKNPLVSIIIVTFNSLDYIRTCLRSVFAGSYQKIEVIVIDNGSNDGTVELIRKEFPQVRLEVSKGNLGYAGGNNLGAKITNGKLLAILNPDTKVTVDWLEPLVESLYDNNIAACQPKILLREKFTSDGGPKGLLRGGGLVVNSTGKTTHFLGFDWLTDYCKKDYDCFTKEITSFSGSAVLMKKDVFGQLGGFDESYFMYCEDGDLSWRMRLVGYKILFVPQSVVYHDYKYQPEESYQKAKQKFYLLERNRLVNLIKNYSARSLLMLLPVFVITEIGMNIYFLSRGWYLEKFRGYIWILSNLLKILTKRKLIQANRKITDDAITKDFVSRIDFIEFNNSLLKYIANPILSFYWFLVRRFM